MALAIATLVSAQDPAALARDYAAAVEAVNKAQADNPTAKDERELGRHLPAAAAKLPERLARIDDSPAVRDALVVAAKAALDLDRIDDFEVLRARLAALDAASADTVGIVVSRPRFVAIGTQGMHAAGLAAIADVFDLVLDGYRDVFGIEAFSKVTSRSSTPTASPRRPRRGSSCSTGCVTSWGTCARCGAIVNMRRIGTRGRTTPVSCWWSTWRRRGCCRCRR